MLGGQALEVSGAGHQQRAGGALGRVEGGVLPADLDVPSPTARVHDSQTQIRSDGIGPRFYDPATKRDVRVDESGSVIREGDDG